MLDYFRDAGLLLYIATAEKLSALLIVERPLV